MADGSTMPPRAAAGTETVTAPAGGMSGRGRAVFVAILVGETALLASAMAGSIGAGAVLGLHVLVMATAGALLWRPVARGDDDGTSQLGLLATLVTGPFGAVGVLLLPWLCSETPRSAARLAGWYRRIALSAEQDDFTTLSDRIAIGRGADMAAAPPRAFADLFRGGPLADQQVALGMIARGFHAGYLPILKIALESAEPVIRVQAAAVAARVRPQLAARVTEMLDRAANPVVSPAGAAEIAANLAAAIASGLLDDAERGRAERTREALLARGYARADARARARAAGHHPDPEQVSADATDAYAEHLLKEGRFVEFRALRTAVRRPLQGRFRRRLLAARRPAGPHVRLVPLAVRR